MLVPVPLYSQTRNWSNHIVADVYFKKVKSDSPNHYLMPFVNIVN